MLKEYQIENFKAFEGPVTIPIRPLTLIFGANSSGKSAILQSLLMLKQTQSESDGSKALVPKGPLVDLGSFKELIHGHDNQKQFSFKMTLKAPRYVSDGSDLDVEIMDLLNEDTERLERTMDFDTIGLSVGFQAGEGSSVAVSKIELFVGRDPNPMISYSKGPLKEEEVVNDQIWREVFRILKLQPKSNEDVEWLRQFLGRVLSGYMTHGNVEHPYWNRYRREFPEGEMNWCDYLGLRTFLPERLNGNDLKRIISSYYGPNHEDAGNVSLLTLCAANLVKEVLGGINYIPPLREYPKRFYAYGENEEMDSLLNSETAIGEVNKKLGQLGISYDAQVTHFLESSGNEVGLYGLQMKNTSTGLVTSVSDIGFGVSQIFPVVLKSVLSRNAMVLVEQPELHLHPALQAEVGDLFIESALGQRKNVFIIESHSEHLLLRVMRRIRETSNGSLPDGIPKVTPADVCVLFVQPDGSRSVVHEMPLNERGDLVKPWPGGFFEEGFKELF